MTDISSFVTITSPAITKQYVQGTNLPLHNDLINLANSSTTPIVAAFQSVGGVSFTPSTITIPANGNASVVINYDPTQFESFPVGNSIVNSIITLSANVSPTIPIVPAQPPVVVSPPTPVSSPDITLIVQAIAGPINSSTTPPTVTIPSTGIASVTFQAYYIVNSMYNYFSGVPVAVDSTMAPNTQWIVTGPGFNGNIIGYGATMAVSFSTPGTYTIFAGDNLSSQEPGTTSVQVVISTSLIPAPISPQPPIVPPTGITLTPTPSAPTTPPLGGGGGTTPPIINIIAAQSPIIPPTSGIQLATTPAPVTQPIQVPISPITPTTIPVLLNGTVIAESTGQPTTGTPLVTPTQITNTTSTAPTPVVTQPVAPVLSGNGTNVLPPYSYPNSNPDGSSTYNEMAYNPNDSNNPYNIALSENPPQWIGSQPFMLLNGQLISWNAQTVFNTTTRSVFLNGQFIAAT